ncbi:ankyrin repeat-containing domain protein [Hypoxylon rubiginosum]|uniref:Ankyrin repeat-containing domain protein n=1 Tax=Hypoxylon rubiginosum TaxID=110542 RepID=A0ACB9ZBH1_9PEZI|nr:ankyrin repeat-containing domain protein [Hypoxylon rubiginosum]
MSALSTQGLLAAARDGNVDQLRSCLSLLPVVLPPVVSLDDVLAEAARSNQASTVSVLLQHGAKVTYVVQEAAHQGGEREVYRLLIQHGLDVNCGFGHAGGPLTEAVLAGDLEWVKLLLDNGADPELAPLYGNQAALAVAAANSVDMGIVDLLMKHGARADYKGLLPLAVKEGNVPFVQFILDQGANENERVEESYLLPEMKGSMLQLAMESGHNDIVEILLKHGASFNTRK